jgi:photosystem II stability/assembly factor-like uncharacterized protein
MAILRAHAFPWVGAGIFLLTSCGSKAAPDGSDTPDMVTTGDTTTGAGGASSSTTTTGSGGSGSPAGTGGSSSGSAGSSAGGSAGSSAGGASGGGPGAMLPTKVDCSAMPSATAPAATWVNATGNLNCGSTNLMAAQPCSNMVVAGVNKAGLWATTNAGQSWAKLGDTGTAIVNGPTGDTIHNGPTRVLFDPKTPTTFWESGIYGWQDPWTMGVFVTVDNGKNFTGFLQLSVIQSQQDSVSVDFHDPDRKTLLAGGHEQKQVLFRSVDGGKNFTDIGKKLPATVGFCTSTLVLDSSNFLVGCAVSFSMMQGAILRSSDGGETWKQVSDKGARGIPLWASSGAIYWPGEAGGLLKSTDVGMTWTAISDGSGAHMYSNPPTPAELPDGRILSATSKNIVVSGDGGATWKPVGPALPQETDFTYSAATKTFYIWKAGCMTAGWDYEAK